VEGDPTDLWRECGVFDISAHGVGMEQEFRRNSADLPMLGVKQVADAGDLFIGNHASPREKG